MKNFKLLSVAACLATGLSSCYNSHNTENIIGKWSGTSTETCGSSSTLSAMQIEFTSDNKFKARITPTGGKPITTSGRYIIERYKLTFLNERKEEDVQKIESLSETAYEGSLTGGGCTSKTSLKKLSM